MLLRTARRVVTTTAPNKSIRKDLDMKSESSRFGITTRTGSPRLDGSCFQQGRLDAWIEHFGGERKGSAGLKDRRAYLEGLIEGRADVKAWA